MEKAQKIKTYVLLHALMLIFSLSPVCSKLAGQQPFLSFKFIFFYGFVILLLGIYALLWQQIIKRMPLTTAYANKAVTVVWGMVWGALLFQEDITPQKCIGTAIIVAGVMLYAFSDSKISKEASVDD